MAFTVRWCSPVELLVVTSLTITRTWRLGSSWPGSPNDVDFALCCSFNQLDLPAYETYDKLRSMLKKAVDECPEGFGLAWSPAHVCRARIVNTRDRREGNRAKPTAGFALRGVKQATRIRNRTVRNKYRSNLFVKIRWSTVGPRPVEVASNVRQRVALGKFACVWTTALLLHLTVTLLAPFA